MGYLDGTSVTVDAVLTKKGREILSKGQALNITSFTAADTGVDYTLWNPDHPSGSAFYGEAIENLPQLEAGVHAEYALVNRLVTLPQNTVAIPAIELSGLTTPNTLTFENGDTAGLTVTATLKGFSPSPRGGANGGFYFVIYDDTVAYTTAAMSKALSGPVKQMLLEVEIPYVKEFTVAGNGPWTMNFIPNTELLTAGRSTNCLVIHGASGAYTNFTITNNITRLTRDVLSTSVKG